jgi:hypothetical protein
LYELDIMTATVEDAIQGYIATQKRRLHPSHNAAFLSGVQTTIRILEDTPRDLDKVQLLIDQKEVALNKANSIEQGDVLHNELQALEWLRMILRGSDRERETWAQI